jgi:threonine dehydrogenase-like Zn-dependent dehydrogenase
MGFEVHVLDKAETGAKPELVRSLGATYHSGSVADLPFEPDAIIECTGVGQLISDSVGKIGANGIVCLTGIGHGGAVTRAGIADIAAAAVLRNNVIVGSVNANKRHWYRAAQVLSQADRSWLAKLITRREKPENFMSALTRNPDDIKVIIQFSEV